MFDTKKKSSFHMTKDNHSAAAEAYRSLRTNLAFYASEEDCRAVLLASPEKDADAAVFSENLALTMACAERKVLLVDADLRDGALTKSLNIADHVGLSDLLRGTCQIEDAFVPGKVDDLTVLPCGTACTDPAEQFAGKKSAELLAELRGRFDYILFTAPNVADYTDAVVLSQRVDGTVLLLAADATRLDRARKCKEKFESVNATLLGAVLNNCGAL